MSDQRSKGLEGEPAADAYSSPCDAYSNSSPNDASQAVALQLSDADEHLPNDRHGSETGDTDAAAEIISLDQNFTPSKDNKDTEKCAVGDHPPPLASEPAIPESGEAVAAACTGNSIGFPMADLEAKLALTRQVLECLESRKRELNSQCERAEEEINLAADRALSQVDNWVNRVHAVAAEVKSERLAQAEQTRARVDSSIVSMNFHHLLAEEILQHGTPAEIAKLVPQLHASSDRILNEEIPELLRPDPEAEDKMAALEELASRTVDVMRWQASANPLGHITHSESVDTNLSDGVSPYLSQPKLIATTAMDNRVCGLAFLNVHLFVIRDRSSDVEVYATSSEGLVLSRQISVEQMTCPTVIAACPSADCLFVSDSQVLESYSLVRPKTIVFGRTYVLRMMFFLFNARSPRCVGRLA